MYIMFLLLLLIGCAYEVANVLPDDKVRIKKGDTLEAIARKNDVSLAELITYNNIKAPYIINIGDVLSIPLTATDDEDEDEKNSGPLFGHQAIKNKPVEKVYADVTPPTTVTATPMNSLAVAMMKRKEAEMLSKPVTVKDEADLIANVGIETKPIKVEEVNNLQKPKKEISKNEEMPENQSSDMKEDIEEMEIVAEQKPVQEIITPKVDRTKMLPPMKGFKNLTNSAQATTLKLQVESDPYVYAIDDGEVHVSDKSYPGMGGRMVAIKHTRDGKTYLSVYGGLKDINNEFIKQQRKTVKAGEKLGHLGLLKEQNRILHFELRKETSPIAPGSMIDELQIKEKSKPKVKVVQAKPKKARAVVRKNKK